jgi:tetratricopeptide (TPR) repeat protein
MPPCRVGADKGERLVKPEKRFVREPSVLERQGKYEEAEAMHRQALEAREKVLGREHPDTLTSVNSLAYLLAKLCDYKESLDLYNRACDGYSVVLGEHHPTTQACRQHRSEVLALQEQL